MPDLICDTSPIQYLHQLDLLHVLPALAGRVFVPPAVLHEIDEGLAAGVDLPNLKTCEWLTIRSPTGQSAWPYEPDLGPGEVEVLLLAEELKDAVVVFDDHLARTVANRRHLQTIGTLGLLLNAKQAGLVISIREQLDRLQAKRFRVSPITRAAVLKLAGEEE